MALHRSLSTSMTRKYEKKIRNGTKPLRIVGSEREGFRLAIELGTDFYIFGPKFDTQKLGVEVGSRKYGQFAAAPYLDAMGSLTTLDDKYGVDTGRTIVSYFMCNVSQWWGPVAKAIKAELNKRLKAK